MFQLADFWLRIKRNDAKIQHEKKNNFFHVINIKIKVCKQNGRKLFIEDVNIFIAFRRVDIDTSEIFTAGKSPEIFLMVFDKVYVA